MSGLLFNYLNEITLLVKMLLLIFLVQGLARYISKLSSYWIAQSWLMCFLMVMLLPLIAQWLPSIEFKLLTLPVEQFQQFVLSNDFDSGQLPMTFKPIQTKL